MAYFDWRKKYSVSIDEMDIQHKQWIQLLNDYYTCIQNEPDRLKEHLGRLIYEVSVYADAHFDAEEDLMLQYEYPGYDEEKLEHDKLRKEIDYYKSNYDSGKLKSVIDFSDMLKKWLKHHIIEYDKRYGAYIYSIVGDKQKSFYFY